MTAPSDEASVCFEESRRLTGANLYFGSTAVVLTPLGAAAADPAAHERWALRVRTMCCALGWPDPQPIARSGVLAFAAPDSVLFTATEVNEWAWERAADEVEEDLAAAGHTVEHPVTQAAALAVFAARAERETARPLLRLKAAARQRGIVCIADDDTVSLGAGSSSQSWPRAALPLPMDVPWVQLHDVPTILVTGSNGKTTTTRLLAAMFTAAGCTAGLCSTAGVYVGDELVSRGDYAGPAGARAVLRHLAVQAAVLETARGGLLRRGLAIERADAAIVTNVSEDHLGEYGIGSVEDIAEAKLIVAHAVTNGGTLVLNADDACLMRVAARLPHVALPQRALFAGRHDHPLLTALREAGGSTCGLREGRLVVTAAGIDHDLGLVSEMPLSLGGAAAFNVQNIAAAVLAAQSAGLPVDVITSTLVRFGAQPEDNPGRLERHSHRGATVLIDYAHNPDGLDQLLQVAQALQPRRLGLLLGQAGNRDDAAIRALAHTAARFAPDRIVIKELPLMLRGRAEGEVPGLLADELHHAGISADRTQLQPDEEAAAHQLLTWAQPGDVIVLPLHTAAVRERVAAALGA